jgi:CubicO group peptidase (beta-lactamase class C family)
MIRFHRMVFLLLPLVLPEPAHAQPRMVAMTVIEADDPRAELVRGLAIPLVARDSIAAANYLLRHAAPSADPNALLEQLARVLAEVRQLESPALGEFTASEEETPQSVGVRLATGPGPGLGLLVTITGEPLRITRIGPSRSPPPPPPADRFTSFAEMDQALRQRAQQDRFSGVALAARGNEILFHRAYGMADRERGTAVSPDTRFNLGSGNKQFTAVAVLRLAQEGRLELDAPVGRYLRDLPTPIAEQVTIRHLLQHRSGLGDYMRHPDFNRNRQHRWSTQELLALIRSDSLAFTPGTRRVYSNSGYVVLGAVIEALTGRDYADVVREWVYQPAGMVNSGPGGPGEVANTATGYGQGADGLASNESFRPRPSAAGGGYSTAEDLLRFVRALTSHRLLQPAFTVVLLNGFENGPQATTNRTFEMGGGLGGISVSMRANVDTGDVAIVLANRSHPVAELLTTSIMGIMANPTTTRTSELRSAPDHPLPGDR